MSGRRFALFLAWTALFLALFLFWERPSERGRIGEERAAELAPLAGEEEEAKGALDVAQQARSASEESETQSLGPALAPLPEGTFGPPVPLASITGRCVDEHGRALKGAELELDAESQRGTPFETRRASSDAEGRFRFELDAAGLMQIRLAARGRTVERQCWQWSYLKGAQRVDLGDLRPGGGEALRVVVVDKEDRPLAARWRFELECDGFGLTHGAERRSVEHLCEEPQSEARITGLPAGKADVRLRHAALPPVGSTPTEVLAGQTNEVRLVSHGSQPDLLLNLNVRLRNTPFIHRQEAAHVVLDAPDGSRIERDVPSHHPFGFSIECSISGPHRLRVEKAGFVPFERAEVFPGSAIDVELRGSAALELVVRDGALRHPLPSFGLALRYALHLPQGVETDLVHLQWPAKPPPVDNVFSGLLPGEITAVVSAPDYAPVEVALGRLAENERRKIEVDLARGSVVRGSISDALGAHAPALRVVLGPRHANDESAEELLRRAGRPDPLQRRYETTTDERGRFELRAVGAGSYWIAASGSEHVHAEEWIDLGASEEREVALRLPAEGWLEGEIVGLIAPLPAGCEVRASATSRAKDDARALSRDPSTVIDAEQRFVLGPLPAGEYRLRLYLRSSEHYRSAFGFELELGNVTLKTAVVEKRAFDLSRLNYASVEIELLIDGAAAVGGFATLRRAGIKGERSTIDACVDEKGRARFPLVPNGDYELFAIAPGMTLSCSRKEGLAVAPGQQVRTSFDIAVTRGRVRILHLETGAPQAGSYAMLENELNQHVGLPTDKEGWLQLDLGPGRYTVGGAPLEWTAEGPLQREIRF